jgi:hypothetical protein
MPMIDVYATAGTFPDPHRLAIDLATAVMTIEQVPDIPMFRQNTAAFVHELPPGSLSNVDGESNYVRIQVLTEAPDGGWGLNSHANTNEELVLAARQQIAALRASQ